MPSWRSGSRSSGAADRRSRLRRGLRPAVALGLALLCGDCMVERDRPADPTAVEEDRRQLGGEPVVRITHPSDEQVFFPSHFTEGSGVQVLYGGDLRELDEVTLTAYFDHMDSSESSPFYVERFIVRGEPPGAAFVRAQEEWFDDVVGVLLLLTVKDADGVLVSADSVGLEIR